MQAVQQRGYDLSFIWGIPYYYRQYGYAYAIPGNRYESLPAVRIPAASQEDNPAYTFRSVTASDSAALSELYRQSMLPYALTLTRTPQHWRYLLQAARLPVELVSSAQTGEPLGYYGACTHPDFPGFSVIESALSDAGAALPILQRLKNRASADIQVFSPPDAPLARLAQSLGSQAVSSGQWLFHISDLPNFLRRLAPVFEQRLAAAGHATLTQELTINLYRQAFRLSFACGKLVDVLPLGFIDSSMGADGGDLCIPPDAFVRLLLAHCNLAGLLDAWPDIIVKAPVRSLVEALFPGRPSYLYATYASFDLA
jgi:hypothetical protein